MTSAGPGAVPNCAPYTPHIYFPLPPIAGHQNCGPGAAAPSAPRLMRQLHGIAVILLSELVTLTRMTRYKTVTTHKNV